MQFTQVSSAEASVDIGLASVQLRDRMSGRRAYTLPRPLPRCETADWEELPVQKNALCMGHVRWQPATLSVSHDASNQDAARRPGEKWADGRVAGGTTVIRLCASRTREPGRRGT